MQPILVCKYLLLSPVAHIIVITIYEVIYRNQCNDMSIFWSPILPNVRWQPKTNRSSAPITKRIWWPFTYHYTRTGLERLNRWIWTVITPSDLLSTQSARCLIASTSASLPQGHHIFYLNSWSRCRVSAALPKHYCEPLRSYIHTLCLVLSTICQPPRTLQPRLSTLNRTIDSPPSRLTRRLP